MKATIIKSTQGKKQRFYLAVQVGAGSIYYELIHKPKLREEQLQNKHTWSEEFNIPL